MIQVAIIGCGLVGTKRAFALAGCRLVACADARLERAQKLAANFAARYTDQWESVLDSKDVNLVIVSTPHNILSAITTAAVRSGKHVLVEKPAARSVSELEAAMREINLNQPPFVRVGFNHRYHPAIHKAKQIVDSGQLGDLMYIRARYGHGGRLGYEQEWRAQADVSGGGELLDQGIHLIDLAQWFLGRLTIADGFVNTFFWDMSVEDNAFLILRTDKKQTAFLHASWTEWKNLFSFEIFGRQGKLEISGLGGSYGTEKLLHYEMPPEMGPPKIQIWEYPEEDRSWEIEFAEFLEDIQSNRRPVPGLIEARESLSLIEKVYIQNARTGDQ
jgi:predicted dehydrogenase